MARINSLQGRINFPVPRSRELQIAGLSTAGEVGQEFAKLALDLQLNRLPALLGGANLSGRLALLSVMRAPLQGNTQADLREITVGAIPGAVDG